MALVTLVSPVDPELRQARTKKTAPRGVFQTGIGTVYIGTQTMQGRLKIAEIGTGLTASTVFDPNRTLGVTVPAIANVPGAAIPFPAKSFSDQFTATAST